MQNTDTNQSRTWREIRTRAGLAGEALAKRFEVSTRTIWRFEAGASDMRPITKARLELLYRDLDRLTRARLDPSTPAPGSDGGR